MFVPFQEGSRIFARFRVGWPDQDCDHFLDDLVRETQAEALDSLGGMGRTRAVERGR